MYQRRKERGRLRPPSPTQVSWLAAKKRCQDVTAHNYARYGGRGITFDPRWNDFDAFFADMGERPAGTSLDRIDNDGPYSPENCRWATPKEQGNNRANNRRLTHDGRTQTFAQWAREVGISRGVLYNRIDLGWDAARALSTPVGAKQTAAH